MAATPGRGACPLCTVCGACRRAGSRLCSRSRAEGALLWTLVTLGESDDREVEHVTAPEQSRPLDGRPSGRGGVTRSRASPEQHALRAAREHAEGRHVARPDPVTDAASVARRLASSAPTSFQPSGTPRALDVSWIRREQP